MDYYYFGDVPVTIKLPFLNPLHNQLSTWYIHTYRACLLIVNNSSY